MLGAAVFYSAIDVGGGICIGGRPFLPPGGRQRKHSTVGGAALCMTSKPDLPLRGSRIGCGSGRHDARDAASRLPHRMRQKPREKSQRTTPIRASTTVTPALGSAVCTHPWGQLYLLFCQAASMLRQNRRPWLTRGHPSRASGRAAIHGRKVRFANNAPGRPPARLPPYSQHALNVAGAPSVSPAAPLHGRWGPSRRRTQLHAALHFAAALALDRA